MDCTECFVNTYPLDGDLSVGRGYSSFEQPGSGWRKAVYKYNLDKMTLAAGHLITASPTSNIYVHAARKRCKLQVRHGCNRGRGEGTDIQQSLPN